MIFLRTRLISCRLLHKPVIALLWMILLIAACNSDVKDDGKDQSVTPMKLHAPGGDALLRVIDPGTIEATLEWADDEGTRMERTLTLNENSGMWESEPVSVKPDIEYTFTLTWSSNGIRYAVAEITIFGTSSAQTEDLSDETYEFNFDDDGDGITNYEELMEGTDPTVPMDPNNPPEPSEPCEGELGTDPDSSTEAWNDNCFLRRDTDTSTAQIDPSPFQTSTYVKGVQRLLFCRGHGGAINSIEDFSDGKFGMNTNTAIREFQAAEGLIVDGVVGPNTWGAMQDLVENATIADVTDNLNNMYTVHGVTTPESANIANECERLSIFFKRISPPDGSPYWELPIRAGSNVNDKESFSIDPP